jgi:epoxide hydrolase
MSDAITPFSIDISDEQIDDLKRRLDATRWPEHETVNDWSQGAPLDYVKELCGYWRNEYDWRRCEEKLNSFNSYMTTIDELHIHFLHKRSPHEDALPIIITHGWPGSIVEFHKVIEPLTNPTAHGGDAADAFHVVCPSLPGYGFSGKPQSAGWNVERIGHTWNELMLRLGYDRYVAQGGDWGSVVTQGMGLTQKENCAGIHINMPIVAPDEETFADLTELEQSALDGMAYYDQKDSGYSKQQSTRPQTLAYGLADSPSGQAAWIVEKFWSWTDPVEGASHPEAVLTKDELLDNIMLYWLTGSAASSARLYWESFNDVNLESIDMPVGCSIFPKEIFRSSKRWAQKRFPNLIYWNELDKGGHFAAFEQPELFVGEVRSCFRLLRD